MPMCKHTELTDSGTSFSPDVPAYQISPVDQEELVKIMEEDRNHARRMGESKEGGPSER